MGTLTLSVVAVLSATLLAGAASPAAQAAPIRECGNLGRVGGVIIWNVTSRDVGCRDARGFARRVGPRKYRRSRRVGRWFCRVQVLRGEVDVRCTRRRRVIRFQYRAVQRPRCDPNYRPCVPRYPPDLDCPDIGRRVEVIGPDDPHGLDRDGDGIGCDSYG